MAILRSNEAWVAGEALMDLIPVTGGERVPMVGGGAANGDHPQSTARSR